jgi:hypothetical protein
MTWGMELTPNFIVLDLKPCFLVYALTFPLPLVHVTPDRGFEVVVERRWTLVSDLRPGVWVVSRGSVTTNAAL